MQDENFNENLSLTDDETPLPEGWRLVRLGDVCEVVTGGTPPRSESKFYHGSIPWIKPDDLDKSIYVETSAEYLSDEGGKISRLLPKGSVLVSCIGNIGKLAIAAKTLTTNQQINSLIPSENIDSLYLYYACKVIKPKLISEASISLVSILNKSNFSNIKIPLPPKNKDGLPQF
jgi:type I restriction enzyme, S subunit